MGYWHEPKYSMYRLMYQLANPRSISSQSFVCEPKGHHWSRANALLPHPKQKFMRNLNHNHRQRKYPHYTMILFIYYETYIWIDCSDSIILKGKESISAPQKIHKFSQLFDSTNKKHLQIFAVFPIFPPFINHQPPKPSRHRMTEADRRMDSKPVRNGNGSKGSNHSNQGFGPG